MLHNEKGPAIKFKDGWSFWFLNGVSVPQWIVETLPEDITPEKVLEIKNVEVRREAIRKMGIDRLINKGKVIDKAPGYELIDLGNLFVGRDNFYAPYLAMRNPSTNIWHVEGIHEDCRTIDSALQWRNQSDKPPVKLT